MHFFRVFQHLLPRATAWRTTVDKALRRYLLGWSQAPAALQGFIDRTWLEVFPAYTTELARWETQFGLVAASDETARRLQLAGAWAAQGGQSPSYLEGVVRAAGFDVRLYEWWSNVDGAPWVARDPHDYTELPRVGTVQAGDSPLRTCATSPKQAPPAVLPPGVKHVWELYPQANRFLTNNPGYLVNDNLTPNAPPPIPDDPSLYPYFLYWAGETIDQAAPIPSARRAEFERLVLKICPAHCWIVINVDYGYWLIGNDHRIGELNLRVGRPAP
jgi:hypothetical protein